MKYIESILDRHTMYQVIIASLGAWAVLALLFSVVGWLPYAPLELLLPAVVITATALIVHYLAAWMSSAPANLGSTVITIFILFFLFAPTTDGAELVGIAGATVVGILSKYLLAYRKLHIVNPAALAAVVAGAAGFAFPLWWIGTPVLAAFVLVGGVLIAWKIRRLQMVFWAAIASFVVFAFQAFQGGYLDEAALMGFLFSSPLIFFLTVMLTEPLTTPAKESHQIMYGVFVGALSSIPFAIGPLYNTPELSLVIANLLAYPLSLRSRLVLSLNEVVEVAKNTLEFRFAPSHQFAFTAGQYLEWTLPHEKPDSRGIRRYFTIASAPTEEDVKLTVRVSDESSTYKQHLQAMSAGAVVYATSRNGDFVLPSVHTDKKYLFIAGGIGVTPFRSQIKGLLDTNTQIDGVLMYCNRHEEDIAYQELFEEASRIGLTLVNVLSDAADTWPGERGFITHEMLDRQVPDYAERHAYISGPPTMVGAYTKLLRDGGMPSVRIKTDYFPGLA